MFWWLGLALFVDGIDGPIARKLEVKEILPTWSGELLDNIIDYVTYVLIPAFALYQRGFMGERLSFLSAAIIVVSSAIYYADTGMKTKENFFKGFPVVWNMVVFTLFVIEPGQWVSFAVVVVAGILTFVPVNFIHPVRVVRLRPINLGMTLLWCAFGALALAQAALASFYDQIGVLGEQVSIFTKIGITVTGLYLALHRRDHAVLSQSRRKQQEILTMTKADPKRSVSRQWRPRSADAMRTSIRAARHRAGRWSGIPRSASISSTSIYRSGLYPPPAGLPLIPGSEAAGVVIETGEGRRLAASRAIASPMRCRSAPMPKSA